MLYSVFNNILLMV